MRGRRIRGGALAVAACAAMLGACQDFFVDPATPDTAGLAILLQATSSARSGQTDAFDRAERARIRVTRGSAEVVFDETVALPPAGEQRAVEVEVEIEGDVETLELETQLLWSGSVLFQGSASVSLQRGGTTDVNVALSPVAAGVQVAAPTGPITAIGGTLQLEGTVVYATGDAIDGATVGWTSLDSGIATVSPLGLVTAHAEGVARIVASGMGQQTTVSVTVQLAVASIDVTPLSMELAVGATRQATATPRDIGGNALDRPVTWQSSASGVASVDGSGVVRGVAAGTATVTASAGGVTSAGITVVVTEFTPEIQLSTDRVSVGAAAGTTPAQQVVAIANGGTGTLSGLTASIAYEGSAQGWLTAQLAGTTAPTTLSLGFSASNLPEGTYRATVTVASSAGAAPKSIAVELTVSLNPVAFVLVEPVTATLLPGETVQLAAHLYDANGNVLPARPVTWSSDDLAVATVSGTGLVTAVALGGTLIRAVAEGQLGYAGIVVSGPIVYPDPPGILFLTGPGQDPPPQQVRITNAGPGTLTGLTAEITYAPNQPAGWLAASLTQEANGGTLVLTATSASLPAGSYGAQVLITSSAAGATPFAIPVNLIVQSTNPPVISNIQSQVQQVNACTNVSQLGTVIGHMFDFVDPDGDVTSPVTITYDWSYQPSNRIGTNFDAFAIAGTGAAGSVTLGYCHVFGTDTQVTETFRITDAAGNVSNALTVVTQKPVGANSAELGTAGAAGTGASVGSTAPLVVRTPIRMDRPR